uniref:Uncharacterized protein n=1 Tax=Arundo donax TaxID=35708 RepID=A0A0A9GBC6_ARUDO
MFWRTITCSETGPSKALPISLRPGTALSSKVFCLSSGWRKSSASRPRAAAGEARAVAAATTTTRLRRGRLEEDDDVEKSFGVQ